MNGTIADSIIIRVGHGIISIPRGTNKNKDTERSINHNKPSKESKKNN